MTNKFTTQVGKAIYTVRTRRGLSAKTVAIQSGVSLSTVRALERGTHNVSTTSIFKIGKGLGFGVDELLVESFYARQK